MQCAPGLSSSRRAIPVLVLALWCLGALSILFDSAMAQHLAGAIALLIATLSCLTKPGLNRWIFMVLFTATLGLIHHSKQWGAIPEGLERAAMISAFLASLYVLRAIIQTAPQLSEVNASFTALEPLPRRGMVQLLGVFFGVPLAVGAVSVIAPLATYQDHDMSAQEDIAGWSIRGIGLSVLFSPFTVAMGIVTTSLGDRLHLGSLLLIGVTLATLLLAFSFLSRRCRLPRELPRSFWKALLWVLAPVLVLVFLNLALYLSVGLNPLKAATLLIIPLALLIAIKRDGSAQRTMLNLTSTYWRDFDGEITIFSGALIFAVAVTSMPEVQQTVSLLAHSIGANALISLTVLAIVIPASLGLHMVVPATITLTLFGPVMPSDLHVAFLGLAALVGWAYGAMAALGSLAFLTACKAFSVSPTALAKGENMRFMAGFIFIACTLVLFL
ncbi:hypothetical protein SAMN05661010_03766 [Modicisalibacter muralis]|uniref:Tripartite ATP-independent transporter, DctM component n=2 Tax=Modicisalibacter muralis TaxID=119000 RepID=A0A1G9RQZ3_9GAMM|nr:hypothetical protein SAMN05661010_03766 [Halomonas muralis]